MADLEIIATGAPGAPDTCADDCCAAEAAEPMPVLSDERRSELARRARLLSWASFFIVGGEAFVGIAAGIAAMSWALIGFGVDSLIEGFASLVIVWRFQEHRIRDRKSVV